MMVAILSWCLLFKSVKRSKFVFGSNIVLYGHINQYSSAATQFVPLVIIESCIVACFSLLHSILC
jgi:hypothetical protein